MKARVLDHWAEALLKVDRQDAPGRCCRGDHRIGLGHLDRQRLLDQHVRARREAVQRQRGVERVGRADHRHIWAQLRQQRAMVYKEAAAGLGGSHRPALGVDVGHPDHLGGRQTRQRVQVRRRDDSGAADDRIAQGQLRTHNSYLR